MNSAWNKTIYRIWAPIYDLFFDKGAFLKARKNVFHDIPFAAGEKVLFAGVGTGADLAHVPHEILEVSAVDYSAKMLTVAQRKYEGTQIAFSEMDVQNMAFPDGEFDYVIASLILSVVPDSRLALSEMMRVTKKGGSVIVFDKFAPKNGSSSFIQKAMRPLIRVLGTDIGISFEELIEPFQNGVNKMEDKGILFKGMYRKIILKKY